METTIRESIITPDKALELLKFNKRNRGLRKPLVMFYTDQMIKGLWKFNGEPIIFADGGLLLDGQHRLAAVVKSKKEQKFIIVEGIDPDTFDTIDTGAIRTGGDMLNIQGVKDANFVSAMISSYYTLKRGIVTTSGAKQNIKLSKQEILTEYYNDKDFWIETKSKAKEYYGKLRLMSGTRIGAYIGYLIKEKKHPRETVYMFFYQLFYGKNVENKSIDTLRDKYLREATGQYKLTPKVKHAVLVKAWNAFITGKEYAQLHYNQEREIMPKFI